MVRGTPVRFPSSQDIPAGSPIRFSLSRDSDTRVDRQMSSTSKANRFDFGDCGGPRSPKLIPKRKGIWACWMRARRSRGSLGISTLLEARWQRNEGTQTGPKPGLPGRLAPQKLASGLSTSYDRYG